ncbi:DgyrCDS9078 [Dimorphilus gyrociliatus]|uniref:CCAAT/enhancer-binding protein zeta n=1 Tax=Dimorphilus gyrociliatus TaxID=2664684 RepID=A0A7I8VW02_9ANNE|nr:DgyrCDS9078 [Dimorphilus gyrociliatus]
MNRKKQKSSDDVEEELTLETVLDLGGEKEDYNLLKDVEDCDVLEFEEDFEAEPIKRDDIRSFIKNLGIKEHREEFYGDTDDKKKKEQTKVKETNDKKKEEDTLEKKKKNKNKFKSDDEEKKGRKQEKLKNTNNLQNRKHLLFKDVDIWSFDEENTSSSQDVELGPDYIEKTKTYTWKIFDEEVNAYQKERDKRKSSQNKWMKTVLSGGTLKDKTAALTLLIQESPLHNLPNLDNLINMVKKKGRREAMIALDTLRELFISDLLPERKLRDFEQCPLNDAEIKAGMSKDDRDKKLIFWMYESELKKKYNEFVNALSAHLNDQISGTKQKALGTVSELLVKKPEQEKQLLALMVNKLGDPDYKVASKACYYLTRLLVNHPKMNSIVVDEVERLLYRANIAVKAQYYSICFLNQIHFQKDEKNLASRLLKTYFSFFKAFVQKKDVDNKIMSALLIGVNRAFPFAKDDQTNILSEIEPLYKLIHTVNFNTSLQALMLLYQVMDASDNISDRYYMALYRKMLDPALKNSSKQVQFLNILFKSIRKDTSEKRVKAFVKRLLAICCVNSPNFICGALLIVSEICSEKKNLLVTEKYDEDSDDEERFEDQADEEDETKEKENGIDSVDVKSPTNKSSWIHKKNLGTTQETSTYQPNVRNPLYCNADHECVWELQKLEAHYHPSVSLFAKNLLNNEKIKYGGDPLNDFTLIRFLDRFVFRNPKKHLKDPEEKKEKKKQKNYNDIAVNSEEFAKKKEEDVSVNDVFFHRYFTQQSAKYKSGGAGSDDDDVSDDEFEDFLDGVKKSKKTTKKKSKKDDDDYDDNSDEDADIDSDEDIDLGSDEDIDMGSAEEDFEDEMDDIDDEGDEDDSDDFEEFEAKSNKKNKKKQDLSDLFADAEEFAEYLEEGATNKSHGTMSSDYVNKDNSSIKQLKWERKREGQGKKRKGKNTGKKPNKKRRK